MSKMQRGVTRIGDSPGPDLRPVSDGLPDSGRRADYVDRRGGVLRVDLKNSSMEEVVAPDPGIAVSFDTPEQSAILFGPSLAPFSRPMAHSHILLHYSSAGRTVPRAVKEFAARAGLEVAEEHDVGAVMARVIRSYPAALVIDGSDPSEVALDLCRRIKHEAFTAVVPVIVAVQEGGEDAAAAALEAGADEVLTAAVTDRETHLRLALALRRAERDVSVHPTTLLPGTVQIERDFGERIRSGESFAVCYADLDHFKEFNDRYGYHRGDRIILIVSRILRDIVVARASGGFVGHIGGDDFIFCVPMEAMQICCEEILEVFDALIPLQYGLEDRDRGYFIGKDRRGHEYQVPLMSLSIGVVTNENREFTHTAQVSELATEMKSYAKTLSGSLYVVDRRTGQPFPSADGTTPE
jgi:GGDEF domain-containing protein